MMIWVPPRLSLDIVSSNKSMSATMQGSDLERNVVLPAVGRAELYPAVAGGDRSEQLGSLSAILRGAEALPSLTTPVTELLSRLSSLQDY
jgi:hypothetical protein